MKWTIWIALVAGGLTACANPVPLAIRQAPLGSPAEDVVRAQINAHIGTKVRWGGTIVSVENRTGETMIEIVSRALQSNGRPADGDYSGGRYLARYPGFLDPMVYTKGRLLTTVGVIEAEEMRPIGQFSYAFPVIRVDTYYLWEPVLQPRTYPDPFWYDPWWPYPRPWYRHPYWW